MPSKNSSIGNVESTELGDTSESFVVDEPNYTSKWPTAQIESIAITRIACMQSRDNELDKTPKTIKFGIACFPSSALNDRLVFVADISVPGDDHYAAATVQCGVRFKSLSGDTDDEKIVNRYGKRYGEWISHTLWDSAATALRATIALIPYANIDVPVETPKPTIHIVHKVSTDKSK